MTTNASFPIFLSTAPGLEATLAAEARGKGFQNARAVAGGVTCTGGWSDVWRANLSLRGAGHVTAEIGSFRAMHLAQLDKRARKIEWAHVLKRDVPFRVEATCRKSKIYHSGAAAERIEKAVTAVLGAKSDAQAEITIRAVIEDDLCRIGVDTSGELLHKRGFKAEVNKAPMRETIAAMLLAQCGYTGTEPVVDPMCGAGTFIIEAAEIAAGLPAGRGRHFAFEKLATCDAQAWQTMRETALANLPPRPALRFYGSDRDAGAITMSRANAERAGVADLTEFKQHAVSDLQRPEGPPGLVIVNPPYGTRIGDKKRLVALYAALGRTLSERFSGWRVGLVTTDAGLAKATALPFLPTGAPIAHGGLRVTLYRTSPLP